MVIFSFFFRKNALLEQLHQDTINANRKRERIRHMLYYSKGVTLKYMNSAKNNKKINNLITSNFNPRKKNRSLINHIQAFYRYIV